MRAGQVGCRVVRQNTDGAQQHVILQRMVRRLARVAPGSAPIIMALGTEIDVRFVLAEERAICGNGIVDGRGERIEELLGVNRPKLSVVDDGGLSGELVRKFIIWEGARAR